MCWKVVGTGDQPSIGVDPVVTGLIIPTGRRNRTGTGTHGRETRARVHIAAWTYGNLGDSRKPAHFAFSGSQVAVSRGEVLRGFHVELRGLAPELRGSGFSTRAPPVPPRCPPLSFSLSNFLEEKEKKIRERSGREMSEVRGFDVDRKPGCAGCAGSGCLTRAVPSGEKSRVLMEMGIGGREAARVRGSVIRRPAQDKCQ